jgi:hypothetical protein
MTDHRIPVRVPVRGTGFFADDSTETTSDAQMTLQELGLISLNNHMTNKDYNKLTREAAKGAQHHRLEQSTVTNKATKPLQLIEIERDD